MRLSLFFFILFFMNTSCGGPEFKTDQLPGLAAAEEPQISDTETKKICLNECKEEGSEIIEDQRSRDIVFVVDASLSMYRNDPIASNTCGRMIGIQKVIQGLGERNDTRYSIVSFANQIRHTTSGFYDNYYSMKSAVDSKYNVGATRVVCGSSIGSNYEHGFSGARNLLLKYSKKVRDQYVILISDGKPTLTMTAEGIADSLKSTGVKVITVLTNGRSDILKERIASFGEDGMPMHFELTEIEELYKVIP